MTTMSSPLAVCRKPKASADSMPFFMVSGLVLIEISCFSKKLWMCCGRVYRGIGSALPLPCESNKKKVECPSIDQPRLGQRLIRRPALQPATLVDQLDRVKVPEAGSRLPVYILTTGVDEVEAIGLAGLQPLGSEVDSTPRLASFDVVS